MLYAYFLEVVACWTIFHGFYYAFLRQETFFHWNRAYLLLTLISGLLLPFWEIKTVLAVVPEVVWLPEIVIGTTENTITPTVNNKSFWLSNGLLLIYLVGCFVSAIRLVIALKQILFFVKMGKHSRKADYELVHLTTITAPFSFGKWLFLNEQLIGNPTELQQILAHERAHIQQRHSWDIVLVELLRVFFWWCPFIYFYKRSLRSVHEYLADAAVLQTNTTTKKSYGQFLLKHLQPLPTHSIVNHFHSQIKLRIVMLTKTPSSTLHRTKYLLFLPLFALVAFFTACEKESIAYDAGKIQQEFTQLAEANSGKVTAAAEADLARLQEIHPQHSADLQQIFEHAFAVENSIFDQSIVHKIADEMPRFPGCEDKTVEERKSCADMAMLTFIYENVKYPEAARKAEAEGTVVINFVVDAAGRTHSPKILRPVHESLADAVLAVYEKMEREKVWIPGRKDGEAVNVSFYLPVKFVLQ